MTDTEQYKRTSMLIGQEAQERLTSVRVAVFGLGGVGGAAAEALARAGVGELDLIDKDRVEVSNINRQTVAFRDTVGELKTEIMRERIGRIEPDCRVRIYNVFYLPDTADQIDLSVYDYIVDAIDTVTAKIELITRADVLGVPVISCMGAGNRLDPTAFRVTDIYETHTDPLAKVMRRELKARGIRALKVVCSDEKPVMPLPSDKIAAESEADPRTPGSVSFVPPAAGLAMAGAVICDLIGKRE